jgi:hypothetical protein
MKFTILLLVSCFLLTLSASAQNQYSVKGSVADTASNAKLVNTSISVLNAKDSTLVSFTRAGTAGIFTLPDLKKGKLILLVTYPGYADYVERFTLDSAKSTHDFGRLSMILKAKLLADVIVKSSRAAMKMKGDTTEFDAKAFKVQPNAKVEDLLKQFPGIQVDKDGKITAQGQTVTKVLVDGEEFFGDDPTLVTKNLRADMVDKVQLYDKKSDQATFTGIDDGQKTKTLNIQLKADKKNGYFGKLDGGVGTDGYYSGQALFNKFKAKEKFSAYAIVSNTGKTGLGWQDSQKYGGSSLEVADNGGLMFTGGSGNDDIENGWNGQYNGQGIPLARTGGLHYDRKFNKDKESLNLNYKIGSLEVKGTSNTLSQNNLKDSTINTNANQTYDNYIFRQKLDATYQVKLDTSSNLKIMVDGTLKNSKTNNNNFSQSTREDGSLLNDNTRNTTSNGNTQVLNASAFYTKKFKKKGRTLSALVSESYNQADSKGFLLSDAHFYNAQGNVDSIQHIDQYKTNKTKSNLLNTNFTYTEPLTKASSIIFNYGLGIDNGISDRESFNASAPKIYNVLDTSLSNNFKLNQLSNQVGAFYNYQKKKITVNLGTKVTAINFNQVNEITNDEFKRNFVNWNPSVRVQYRPSQFKYFSIGYRGNPTQPTIDQIQPVAVNTDPLLIVVGNQDLKPSFTNNINANFNSYKVLTGMSFFMYGNYSFTSNPIVSNQVTDLASGKSTIQYVNLGTKQPSNFYLDASVSRKIGHTDLNIGLSGNISGNNSYNFSNSELNFTKSNTYSGGIQAYEYIQKKFDFNVFFGPSYTLSGSSLQPDINNNGRGFNARGSFTVYLPGKFQLASDADYLYRAKTQTFDSDFHRTLVNASLSKTFFKEDNLKFTLAANDLLDQNKGFDRTVNANFIQQNTYTTIKRYFMFSVAWDFTSMGGAAPAKK